MDEGLDGSKHVLPPSNTGQLLLDEVLATRLGGDEPGRLTEQLDEYVNFEYFPHPYTTDQVENIATDERTLRTVKTLLNHPIRPTGTLPKASSGRSSMRCRLTKTTPKAVVAEIDILPRLE